MKKLLDYLKRFLINFEKKASEKCKHNKSF